MVEENQDKIKEANKAIRGLYIFMFSIMTLTLCSGLFLSNHTSTLQCHDYSENGFSTKLMGDVIHRECYINTTLGRFVPIDDIYRIDKYTQLV